MVSENVDFLYDVSFGALPRVQHICATLWAWMQHVGVMLRGKASNVTHNHVLSDRGSGKTPLGNLDCVPILDALRHPEWKTHWSVPNSGHMSKEDIKFIDDHRIEFAALYD